MKNVNLRFLFGGLVSGTVSAVLLQVAGDSMQAAGDLLLYWLPGTVFGVFFVKLLGKAAGGGESTRWLRLVAMILLSLAAWRIAVFVAQFLITGSTVPMETVHEHRFWYAGIGGGVVGGALLAGAMGLLRLAKVNAGAGAAVVAVGAILGALLHFWPMRVGESDFHIGPYILLIPWQGAVAALLGRLCEGGVKAGA